ncbi:transcription termination factor Rho [Crossiella equi]|uniref:Transcription termination factor Rho n=1 Tax=Crossiella equi TaxID=130796 RepID=A0ABS5AJL9_9PSEU|nr:transcription termination factor Rho [Crossiella equi]MBP2476765.1 transcription termination factor Rho [Crossiella equi]
MSETELLGGDAVDTTAASPSANGTATKRRGGLSGMVLAELRQLAGELGIGNTSGMRKGDLIAAIKERQGGSAPRAEAAKPAKAESGQLALGTESAPAPKAEKAVESAPSAPAAAPAAETSADAGDAGGDNARRNRRRRAATRPAGSPEGGARERTAEPAAADKPAEQQAEQPVAAATEQRESKPAEQREQRQERGERQDRGDRGERGERGGRNDRNRNRNDRNDRGDRGDRGQNQNQPQGVEDDEDEDGRGRRGRRFRDRRRGRGRDGDGGGNERGERGERGDRGGRGGGDTEVREDDVLLPVAGILDVLDNYAFVRTSGYLAGPNDVYVSLSLVRRHGLRRGDAITGAVRQPRDGEQQRQKFNPLVRVDSINGLEPDAVRGRPEFTKLTPLYPNERLRLETEPHILTTRVIDLVMPIGKGQRALIVSPPKAGKTSVLQAIANAITTNNPECHLMVVLVDERPEEVTDMQRSVKGEVIASTFDRPPGDHTTVAELSIERAKRLVEMGHDVVVLLDSITRLGRAYNLAAPASGRILSGGVDSTALYPPKRFLGAARNIEGGGSLTIFATALVETGSTMDTVIFEEFKGTGNAELKLDRKIADKRTFPAVDVDASGTRKEELLLSPDELAVTIKLRRVLAALDDQQAIDLLLDRLRKTRTNIEFLMTVSKTAPGSNDD